MISVSKDVEVSNQEDLQNKGVAENIDGISDDVNDDDISEYVRTILLQQLEREEFQKKRISRDKDEVINSVGDRTDSPDKNVEDAAVSEYVNTVLLHEVERQEHLNKGTPPRENVVKDSSKEVDDDAVTEYVEHVLLQEVKRQEELNENMSQDEVNAVDNPNGEANDHAIGEYVSSVLLHEVERQEHENQSIFLEDKSQSNSINDPVDIVDGSNKEVDDDAVSDYVRTVLNQEVERQERQENQTKGDGSNRDLDDAVVSEYVRSVLLQQAEFLISGKVLLRLHKFGYPEVGNDDEFGTISMSSLRTDMPHRVEQPVH